MFLFQLPAEYLPTPKRENIGRRLHVGTSSASPCSMSYMDVVLNTRNSACGELSFLSKHRLSCFEISLRPCWPTTQLNANQTHHWKPFLATKDGWLRLYPHYSLESSLDRLQDSRNFFTVLDFHPTPQIPAVSLHTLSLHPIFPPDSSFSHPHLLLVHP
jgi:hypothetical protein